MLKNKKYFFKINFKKYGQMAFRKTNFKKYDEIDTYNLKKKWFLKYNSLKDIFKYIIGKNKIKLKFMFWKNFGLILKLSFIDVSNGIIDL